MECAGHEKCCFWPIVIFWPDQAFNSFSAFDENALTRINPADIRKKGSVPTNASIFFTIFQTFMSGPDGAPYFGEYPKIFDFIIIDECHRGGANDECRTGVMFGIFFSCGAAWTYSNSEAQR